MNNLGHGIRIRTNYTSNNNSFHHNSFVNNNPNAIDECNNTWYHPIEKIGNYWNDYIGYDYDGDGIGDIPYDVLNGTNQDLYPLMYPYEYYDTSIVTDMVTGLAFTYYLPNGTENTGDTNQTRVIDIELTMQGDMVPSKAFSTRVAPLFMQE